MTVLSDVVWHDAHVTKKDRWLLNNHKSALIWITGLSASGKSTIAHSLESCLYERGIRTYVLDGDNVRHGLSRNLGFSQEDRSENLRRAAEAAKLFVDAGILTIASFISPYKSDREMVRNLFPIDQFIEVYLDCDISVCESRDPKGFYKKARKGQIEHFTGVSDPYEAPSDPEITLKTGLFSVEECVSRVLAYLETYRIV